jgi:hypothetical protein
MEWDSVEGASLMAVGRAAARPKKVVITLKSFIVAAVSC